MKESIEDLLSDPIAVVMGLFASVAGALNLDVLLVVFDGLWASIGTLFTSVSIFAFTVAPNISVSASVVNGLETVAIALAVMYALKKLFDVIDNIKDGM